MFVHTIIFTAYDVCTRVNSCKIIFGVDNMYKRYNNDSCERSRPIMGTWCKRDPWCDREEDDRGRRDCWCEREEDDRGQRDCNRRDDERGQRDCDRREDERGRRNCCDHREDEYENNIYINTNIDIDQEATATGGDGGNGGEAEGGGAALASGGLIPIAINELEIEANLDLGLPVDPTLGQNALVAAQPPNGTGTTVSGGDADAEGGDGGNATATNIAEVTVENVIIITGNSDHPMPPIHLGSNGRNMDIKIDKEGNAFVNGKKLDAQNLEDGSKVLIFRDNQVKKEEKKDKK